MAHQPDVQKRQQEQHQQLQEQPNIVYIQQDPQNYRNQNYQYSYEGQNNIIPGQSFQQQHASYGQYENHYPFISNGHFSSSNSSATLIPNCFEPEKNKVNSSIQNSNTVSDNDQEIPNCHQVNESNIQINNGNFQSVDLQNLSYQQSSQFFLPNIGNQYQLNDLLVPTYQSSGSSESSDESSISNTSQHHYSNEVSNVSANQFEFPVPVPATNQIGQNFQQLQQKDFLDNYIALLHQDNQIPRCDSSKSEAADSTCSSLSSGSTESQSENESVVQLPVLVNPVLNNTSGNVFHSYQTNIHNNVNSYSSRIHHNTSNNLNYQAGHNNNINSNNNNNNNNNTAEQNVMKCNENYAITVNSNSAVNGSNLGSVGNILPPNSQVNNVVVMVPNRINKNIHMNQTALQNSPSPDVMNSSKFIIQNQKVNQQKIFGLINVRNQMPQERGKPQAQFNQIVKVNNGEVQESFDVNEGINNRKNNKNNFKSDGLSLMHTFGNHESSDDVDTSASHNTSDSSVINSNFVQNNFSNKSIGNETNSAMLKETSDKSINQYINNVNNSMVDSSNVYLVKSDENNVLKSVCYGDPSNKSFASVSSSNKALPVPVGWRRLLVDGTVIYLSPSNVALSSIEQVKMYLQTVGTCKCGLECPVNCDSVFNFNPKVISRPWNSSDSELTRLCNHKRKAPVPETSVVGTDKHIKLNKKEIIPTKRKKKKQGSSNSGVSVSQLLAQRDRALVAASTGRWPNPIRQSENISYQNIQTNQYQNMQMLQNQSQDEHLIANDKLADSFNQCHQSARLLDDKAPRIPCVRATPNSERDRSNLNATEIGQFLPENSSSGHDLLRASQMNLNPISNQRQEVGQGGSSHINYNIPRQEVIPNSVMGPRPEGVVVTPQGMVFQPNMIMQRPRSIPPWHQTKLGLNKKPVSDPPILYERVPYIQQHMPPPSLVYEDNNSSRKKHRAGEKKIKKIPQESVRNQPSFMENPSAYLAQQTALLHNTISLPNFNLNADSRDVTNLPQSLQNLSNSVGVSTNVPVSNSNVGFSNPPRNPTYTVRPNLGQKINQSNFNQSQIYNKPLYEKMESSEDVSSETNADAVQNIGEVGFNNHVCSNENCVECKKSYIFDSQRENHQMNERIRIIQENLSKSGNFFNQQMYCKNNWNQSNFTSEDQMKKPPVLKNEERVIEENPVTSSTEKAPSAYSQKIVCDSRPIQGGTISTSNESPQPQASPNSSVIFKSDGSSPKGSESVSLSPGTGNMLISSSTNNSVAVSTDVCSSIAKEIENNSPQIKLNDSCKKKGMNLNSLNTLNQRAVSPDSNPRFKYGNSNFANVTTSDQKFQAVQAQEEQIKAQSVSSTFDLPKEDVVKIKTTEPKGNRIVRTMASGHTVSSNTITSVQAGKTQTTTVTVNNNSTPPCIVSLANFSNNLNVPINQKGNTKSPLEMVQSVVSSIQTSPTVLKNDAQPNLFSVNKTVLPTSSMLNNILTTTANISTSIINNNNSNATPVLKTSPGNLQTGHILVSNNGQYIVASSGNVIPQANINGLKLNQTSPMPPMSASPVVTNVTGAVTQVLPAVGVAQQVLGQPTVLVNTLPAPFVIQPGVMAVETGLGRLAVATGNVLQGNLIENNALRNSVRGVASPEKVKNKKGNKKRKNQVASLVQMTSPNNMILNQSFGQQNFAVSPGGNIQPLQALTLVQGKHGGPAQIVMNNQNNFNQFNTQPQQINLLQPVNLTSVPNFPAFQQFIVPGLGNMVMSADGTTTILPDTNIGVQLQLQNVNGQNVLTPVQNTGFINSQGILTTPAGMLIRAPNSQQKIVQNSSSPQFLSPNNSQFLVNQFQGQLSPLIAANLSPNQQIFTSSPPRQSPQEFIQIIPTSSSQNTTLVQQNTTIVQQQTTMVSQNQNILSNSGKSNFILNNPNVEKPLELQLVGTSQRQTPQMQQNQRSTAQEKVDIGTQHSVSTQTVINKESGNVVVSTNNTFCQTLNSNWSGSPPDTTTHSPVESEQNHERAVTPASHGTPEDCLPQAMVQYVSSSINEVEGENESYLLSGIPKILANCDLSGCEDKSKSIVESSTILQETGVQIQIGNGYVSSRQQKYTSDDCVVSSHSDVNILEKQLNSQPNITSYQEDNSRMADALLSNTKLDNMDHEASTTERKEVFSEGDLVWGPIRGSPAWPGKLVGPVSSVGKALVRWFGGHSSPTRVNVSQLQSLSQGLEAHHRASNKGRKNRRLNIELEAAIQEAMLELDKMTASPKKLTGGSGRPRRSHR